MNRLGFVHVTLIFAALCWFTSVKASPVGTAAANHTVVSAILDEKVTTASIERSFTKSTIQRVVNVFRFAKPDPTRQAAADVRGIINEVKMLDASDQAFTAVSVDFPVNFKVGEREFKVGLGWIGPQNNRPSGNIDSGSVAPQFSEKRFRDSTENSVVFLFRMPL